MNNNTTTIRSLYDAATGCWTGADWTHELIQDARDVRQDERPVYCDGSQQCDRCESAAESAQSAESLAARAMSAIHAGDVSRAQSLAVSAVALEADYGDAPTWGSWGRAVQAING